jgi:hypothetical protein
LNWGVGGLNATGRSEEIEDAQNKIAQVESAKAGKEI